MPLQGCSVDCTTGGRWPGAAGWRRQSACCRSCAAASHRLFAFAQKPGPIGHPRRHAMSDRRSAGKSKSMPIIGACRSMADSLHMAHPTLKFDEPMRQCGPDGGFLTWPSAPFSFQNSTTGGSEVCGSPPEFAHGGAEKPPPAPSWCAWPESRPAARQGASSSGFGWHGLASARAASVSDAATWGQWLRR